MPTKVFVNIYDLVKPVNDRLRVLGTGAFHAGVEVYGREYSFGFCYSGTGIFPSKPKQCVGPDFRESIDMGQTQLSEAEVLALIQALESEWVGTDYDILRRNCCIFSNYLCERLGVGSLPKWITNLAAAGATVANGIEVTTTGARRAAIIAAAKAGQIDEKYNIRGAAQAKAQDFIEKAKAADGKLQITTTALGFASKAVGKASEMAGKAANAVASAGPQVPTAAGKGAPLAAADNRGPVVRESPNAKKEENSGCLCC